MEQSEECKEKLLSEEESQDHTTEKTQGVVFHVGHERKGSSTSQASFASEEEWEPEAEVPGAKTAGKGGMKLSGGCMLKLTAVVYLVGCILVSALYVAIYGQRQQFSSDEEVWIPGKPTRPHSPEHHSLQFLDAPYTEWMAHRWTYTDRNFSDWPSLPGYVDVIQQVMGGSVGGEEGVWLLTDSELFFTMNLSSQAVSVPVFLNASGETGITVTTGSRLAGGRDSSVFLATPDAVYLLDCSASRVYCTLTASTTKSVFIGAVQSAVVSLSDDCLWIGTDMGLYTATIVSTFTAQEIVVRNASEVVDSVLAVGWRSDIAPSYSTRERAAFFFRPDIRNSPQPALAYSTDAGASYSREFLRQRTGFGLLVVGTDEKLFFFDGVRWWFEWVSVWEDGAGGVVDGPPAALAFGPKGEIYVANNVSVTRINVNYTFDRIGPREGLPYNQITALYYAPYSVFYPPAVYQDDRRRSLPHRPSDAVGTLWVGTERGYALFDLGRSEFVGYFFGPRWLPGGAVLGVAGSGGNATIVLTEDGVSVVHPEEWTLARKADHYQGMLPRHTREPGLVADCPLTDFDPSTCAPYTTDNDGLWTSWLVAAEAFRYQTTRNVSARKNAWSLFRGMQFLVNVTGVKGLFARSVLSDNVSLPSSGEWHNSTTEAGWWWKGDTSSDEFVGHMFAYPIVYNLVAERDDERGQVAQLLDDVVGYIKNNSYYLIDVTNHSTRWGVWNPGPLNFERSWSDERGLNALEITAALLSANAVTGKEEYLDAWKNLFEDSTFEGLPTHYGRNLINQKITFPRDDNFSDDELAFLPYFVYFYSLKQSKLKVSQAFADLSIQRTWRSIGREKSSAWTAIFAYATGLTKDTALLESLVWNLRTWPLELVQWSTTNSHRLDIQFDPEQDRNFRSHSQSMRVLPAFERTQLRWNGNPYELDTGGSSDEMDPGAWLMPYWLARWSGML